MGNAQYFKFQHRYCVITLILIPLLSFFCAVLLNYRQLNNNRLTHHAPDVRLRFNDSDRKTNLTDQIEELYNHAFTGYMSFAFPADELKPIQCTKNIRHQLNTGDFAMGNYSLTLIDALDSLLIFGRFADFKTAVNFISSANYDLHSNIIVSTFEVNIRILGGLLSGHILSTQLLSKPDGQNWSYNGELLIKALNLGKILKDAFDTPTGLPRPRVNLKHSTTHPIAVTTPTTITSAEAGSFLIELGILSLLTKDFSFYNVAKQSVLFIWKKRSSLDLIPDTWDVITGRPLSYVTGVAAGSDSFFEYLLKASILFRDEELYMIFQQASFALHHHCQLYGFYYTCHINNGRRQGVFSLKGLGAFWPSIQLLSGHFYRALHTFQFYLNVWSRYHIIPEDFDYGHRRPSLNGEMYILRPEFFESLFYFRRIGGDAMSRNIVLSTINYFNSLLRTSCGFAAQKNILKQTSLDDKMESFLLSETLMYLYLSVARIDTISSRISINLNLSLFSTEGHIFPIPWKHTDIYQLGNTDDINRQLCLMTSLNCHLTNPIDLNHSASLLNSNRFTEKSRNLKTSLMLSAIPLETQSFYQSIQQKAFGDNIVHKQITGTLYDSKDTIHFPGILEIYLSPHRLTSEQTNKSQSMQGLFSEIDITSYKTYQINHACFSFNLTLCVLKFSGLFYQSFDNSQIQQVNNKINHSIRGAPLKSRNDNNYFKASLRYWINSITFSVFLQHTMSQQTRVQTHQVLFNSFLQKIAPIFTSQKKNKFLKVQHPIISSFATHLNSSNVTSRKPVVLPEGFPMIIATPIHGCPNIIQNSTYPLYEQQNRMASYRQNKSFKIIQAKKNQTSKTHRYYNKIVFAQTGVCNILEKAYNIQKAGGVALVIVALPQEHFLHGQIEVLKQASVPNNVIIPIIQLNFVESQFLRILFRILSQLPTLTYSATVYQPIDLEQSNTTSVPSI